MSQYHQSHHYCVATARNLENVELIESELGLWAKSRREFGTLKS